MSWRQDVRGSTCSGLSSFWRTPLASRCTLSTDESRRAVRPFRRAGPNKDPAHPLSKLDGLNISYEARLAEEGIEDMLNLVTANLVGLMLRTRAPIDRLVDWVDQALLYLHLPTAHDLGSAEERPDIPARSCAAWASAPPATSSGHGTRSTTTRGFCRLVVTALGMSSVDEGRALVQRFSLPWTATPTSGTCGSSSATTGCWLTRDERCP